MGKQRVKPNYRRRLLRLPDLDHCKRAVLNSLGSPASRRVYEYAIDQFIAWYCSEPRLAFNRIVVMRYRMYLESRHLAANTSLTAFGVVLSLCSKTTSPRSSNTQYQLQRSPRSNPTVYFFCVKILVCWPATVILSVIAGLLIYCAS